MCYKNIDMTDAQSYVRDTEYIFCTSCYSILRDAVEDLNEDCISLDELREEMTRQQLEELEIMRENEENMPPSELPEVAEHFLNPEDAYKEETELPSHMVGH
jgi:hypothetical protein